MPDFDDVTQPPQFRQQLEYPISIIERYTVLLKDGETTATIYPIHSAEELPPGLLAFLCDEFNMEVERGDTFPFFDTLHIETFQNYWFGSFAAVMVLGDSQTLDRPKQWEKECLGTFYIKPNYPGRCSHICTAGFLVNAGIRGKGIGRTLAECYLEWAPRLGYTYSVFNLVFETNDASRRIWESLNFKKIGKIKAAGILKGHDNAVDAIIYGRELVQNPNSTTGSYRFDKIKFYLESGKYPAMADRQEKSRLRSSASHYRLENGKLMLKGREVISDPARQMQICTDVHMTNHGGINKTTSLITEKYHWTRIKDTVAAVIRNCPECRDPRGLLLKRSSLPAIKKAQAQAQHQIQALQQHQQQLAAKQAQHAQQKHLQHHYHSSSALSPENSSGAILVGGNNSASTSNKYSDHNSSANSIHNRHLQQAHNNEHHNHDTSSKGDTNSPTDVVTLVGSDQLQQIPSHTSNHMDSGLLTGDFDPDDPSGIIAAVEAAQRSAQQAQSHQQHRHHDHHQQAQHHQQHVVAQSQAQNLHHQRDNNGNSHLSSDNRHSNHNHDQYSHDYNEAHDQHEDFHYQHTDSENEEDVDEDDDDDQIDPEVISRALIQANEGDGGNSML